MRPSISIETRLALSLNSLDMAIRDVFRGVKSMASIIEKKFCKVVRKNLQKFNFLANYSLGF